MQCVDIAERLLVDQLGADAELDRHVAGCTRCAQLARGLQRLDSVLSARLVVAPPVDLQRQLAVIAVSAARPRAAPWWARLGELNLTSWLGQRPQMIGAQGLAAVLLAVASWQVFGLVSSVQPVVGDVGYAMELVAGSPAAAYLSSLQIDVQSLGLWSIVGILGWLVSEGGLIGGRLAATRLRLP